MNGMLLCHDDYRRSREFAADIVVVGTGAGGAVAGTELAESGRSVLFVEEGSYHPTSSFNPYLTESIPRLYRDGAATAILGSPMIPYVEGRTVGGSTVINGGMAYRAPERVLTKWGHGGCELGPRELEPLFERVERRLHVAPQDEVSIGEDSRLMARGARKMGWKMSVNRRSQRDCVGTNNCGFGCPTGAKQSTLVSYLPHAFAAGAGCLTDVRVEKLLIEHGRCVGVEGRAIDPATRAPSSTIIVRARAVVIACGAVQTPYLLLRHGLGRKSRQLGRNFSCHPNAKVIALYPFDVEGWKGVSQNGQIHEFTDDGIVMAENFVAPGALGAHLPFHGREAWDLMGRLNQILLSGVLVEDSGSGTVARTFLGVPEVHYTVTAEVHRRVLRGAKLLAEMHFALGADKVLLPFVNVPILTSVDQLRGLDEKRVPCEALDLFTVHLMGTARMGASPNDSVVGPTGECWALPGCYIADASLFPTAIGVNPQLTVMALATRVAFRLDLVKRAA